MMDDKAYIITMPDGSEWAIPLAIIARSRAAYYAPEFGDDIERSLAEDTIPLFEADSYEVRDWACNEMNWSEVAEHAVKVKDAEPVDFDEGWIDGDWKVTKWEKPETSPTPSNKL